MSIGIDILIIAFLFLGLVSPYLLYPLLVRYGFPPRERSVVEEAERLPKVNVLIPAHNEAARLDQKLRNTLALSYPRDRIEILVASDGSDDHTADVGRAYEDSGVRVFELSERGGKLAALNHLLAHAQGELILFTDVGADLPENTVSELVQDLADPGVAVAMPRYASVGDKGAATADGAYWNRETRLKKLEAERDMLLGAHGACYLMRRHTIAAVPADTIHDDLLWPLLARAAGGRIVYRSDIVVPDAAPVHLSTIFERTARMAHGNLQILWRNRALLSPRHARIAASLIGHKLLKTLGPVWILSLALWVNYRALSASALVPLAIAGDALVLFLLGAAIWRTAGLPLPRSVAMGVHALVAMTACGVGILRFPLRANGTRWRRPPENDVLALHRPALPPRSVRAVKRTLDITGSLIGILFALPLIPFIALAIRLDSKGPVLYRQERVAKDYMGRPRSFAIWKFRTMRVDAEADGQAVWAVERDPRITSVGRFLRKLRLDELPQLFQVLGGDMTLVGPRPERPSITDSLAVQLPSYDDRHAPCKPGITGWAQVHTGYDTSVDSVREKLLYDFTYNAHLYGLRSYLGMEIRVILLTLAVIINRKGAH
ncbi:MAG: sugar transferase [Deltaproteobacteria bacterium]|nr:sugar transferase [Deltaproteobacteria bacterium]NND28014.1 glycosyltransferase [Myxococcales bacterium]MBT8465525.1 sugar transferase [Deltaproteobacteria bacterium]MBT8481082.1 sugar transferase [Deltaproteobacteria bacterium]NNK08221.1 glycosyltransferase [Myxococcales bacterium]